MRTAATSAVAVDLLAPRRPLRVAVVGSGFEAANHVAALASVREVAALSVFSPTEANRRRLADRAAAEHGLPARAADGAQEAVRGADLVIAAARSRDEAPTVRGAWLAPGATVVSIGSTLPEQRELDVEALDRAAAIVADVPDEVLTQTGDLQAAAAAGVELAGRVVALADVLAPGGAWSRPEGVVVFKSVGSALQDLTVGELCVRRARERGVGRSLGRTVHPALK
jgi:alanine dehydrogenase